MEIQWLWLLVWFGRGRNTSRWPGQVSIAHITNEKIINEKGTSRGTRTDLTSCLRLSLFSTWRFFRANRQNTNMWLGGDVDSVCCQSIRLLVSHLYLKLISISLSFERCCYEHDKCYDEVMAGSECTTSLDAYVVSYKISNCSDCGKLACFTLSVSEAAKVQSLILVNFKLKANIQAAYPIWKSILWK